MLLIFFMASFESNFKPSETKSQQAARADMDKHFKPDEYGVINYDNYTDQNVVDELPRAKHDPQSEMDKYFGKDEYGVKYYDKDGKEIVDEEGEKSSTEKNHSSESKQEVNGSGNSSEQSEGRKPTLAEEKAVRDMDKYFPSEKEPSSKNYNSKGEEIEKLPNKSEDLQAKVEAARNEFAKLDYKDKSVANRLKRILNLKGGDINSDTRQNALNNYQKCLKESYDFELDKLHYREEISENEIDQKMEELQKYFDTDEKTNLFAARTNARSEAWQGKGKFAGEAMKKTSQFINWYRDLGKTKKGMIGKTAIGVGLGLVGLGGVSRVVGGAAAGMGVTMTMDARYRTKEEERVKKERMSLYRENNLKNLEERIAANRLRLDSVIAGYEKDLGREIKKATIRKAVGFGVGVFIGSGAMSHMLQGAGHWVVGTDTAKSVSSHLADSKMLSTDFWKNKLGSIFGGSVVETPRGEFPFSDDGIRKTEQIDSFRQIKETYGSVTGGHEMTGATGASSAEGFSDSAGKEAGNTSKVFSGGFDDLSEVDREHLKNMKDAASSGSKEAFSGDFDDLSQVDRDYNSEAQELARKSGFNISKTINLEVADGKGGSVDGRLAQFLKDSGIDPKKTGPEAHRMYLNFLKEHNLPSNYASLIHPGAHIEVGPDGKGSFKILDITDEKGLGYLKPDNVGNIEKIQETKIGKLQETLANKPEVQGLNSQEIDKLGDEYFRPENESGKFQVNKNNDISGETHAEASQESIPKKFQMERPTPTNYEYPVFSDIVDSYARQVQFKGDELMSTYNIKLGGSNELLDRIVELESKNTPESSDLNSGISISKLTIAEQNELSSLKEHWKWQGSILSRMTNDFMGAPPEMYQGENNISKVGALDFLHEHPGSKAAKIFEQLRSRLGEDKIKELDLNPKDGEGLVLWSAKVVKFMLKNQLESMPKGQ
ncbi:MAG: hypothetical protein ACD_15C00073G0004 [uncultured bacterium]|nr:MAG: hypothetical protein ACD_15C00073G0004 [uncultured bacterium]